MDVIYLDFKKAFDKVLHRRLLSKIRSHGVRGTLYIDDLDEGTVGILAMFVDDTKIGGGTGSIEEVRRVQKDLDRLGEWAKKWQMEYNV
eukprot:g21191.t1